MTAIVTITLNPAVDLSTWVEKILPIFKLRCTSPHRNPGGGGINVARVIRRFGADVTAIYPIGGKTGDLLRKLLDAEAVVSQTFPILGETREDFFVGETSTSQHYRFILPGPQLDENEWQACLKLITELQPFPRFVVASGSLPVGLPDNFYARIARIAKDHGARMILDTSGPALAAAVAEGVDLIKPNLREMRELIGSEPSDAGEWEAAARAIVRSGGAEIIALTQGHLGAVLVTRDQVIRAQPLPVTPVSAVGAGDSFLGTLIWRFASGADLAESFRQAVAAGAAALLNPGTELCRPDDVKRLAERVNMEVA